MADGLFEYHHDNPHPQKADSREAAGDCREPVDTWPYLWRELCTIAHPGDKRLSAGGKGSEELTKRMSAHSPKNRRLSACGRLDRLFCAMLEVCYTPANNALLRVDQDAGRQQLRPPDWRGGQGAR